MALETYPAVHHLVSAVTGQMRPDLSAVDLLRASFPPGSVTGAPKVRAMEIIAELESAPRGPYCGAYGWFGDDGAMDLAVAIRIAALQDNTVVIHAGGGITADSDPQAEYDETLVKAAPLLAALAGEAP
jgi:para-aminobenzoate synthetase component 1